MHENEVFSTLKWYKLKAFAREGGHPPPTPTPTAAKAAQWLRHCDPTVQLLYWCMLETPLIKSCVRPCYV